MAVKDFLQGKWLGHPLHPALVHVPVGLWPGALLLDVISRIGGGSNLVVQMSFFAILLGLVVAVVAMVPGFADWSGIKREKPAWKLGFFHMVLNLTASLVWLVNLLVRWPGFQEAERVSVLELQLSLAGTVLLAIGGWLGGRMTFQYGTSVARHSKKKWGRLAEKGKAALPEK